VDDDANGFVDDFHGYDFRNHDATPWTTTATAPTRRDDRRPVGNNGLGVVGVNWNIRIMALKFLDAGGSGTTRTRSSLNYASLMGARLTNTPGEGGASPRPCSTRSTPRHAAVFCS